MSEWQLFTGDMPYVSTCEFHQDRERAPHLEQPSHQGRLRVAGQFLCEAARQHGSPCTLSDLGCGDGGLLSVVQRAFTSAWGYDFQPANVAAWPERKVTGYQLDCFGKDQDLAELGDVVCMTEVLEHLADPHGALAWARRADWLVCSSPFVETPDWHAEEHAWAWDVLGYRDMITAAGWDIRKQELIDGFQVVLGR